MYARQEYVESVKFLKVLHMPHCGLWNIRTFEVSILVWTHNKKAYILRVKTHQFWSVLFVQQLQPVAIRSVRTNTWYPCCIGVQITSVALQLCSISAESDCDT